MELSRDPGAVPLYRQLYDLIRRQILTGEYKPGDMIPTELEYQQRFGLSRVTVRQAILALVSDHYLKRIKGKGTIVQPPVIYAPVPAIAMRLAEMPEDCVQIHVTLRIATAHGDVADRFHMAEGAMVYRLRRVLASGGSPFAFFETYLPPELRLENDEELYRGSLYQLLQEQRGIRPARVVQQITAAAADKEAAAMLRTEQRTPLILIKRQAFDQEDRIFAYTFAYYASDRYAFVMETTE